MKGVLQNALEFYCLLKRSLQTNKEVNREYFHTEWDYLNLSDKLSLMKFMKSIQAKGNTFGPFSSLTISNMSLCLFGSLSIYRSIYSLVFPCHCLKISVRILCLFWCRRKTECKRASIMNNQMMRLVWLEVKIDNGTTYSGNHSTGFHIRIMKTSAVFI